MMKISAIRAANAAFTAKQVTNPVAVFVGGSSGIGEAAMRAFTTATVAPTIYFIGRNSDAATSITASLQSLNPAAKIKFIQSDLSLLNNAFTTASTIRDAEKSVNLLFISAGYMTLAGRCPTSEGLEKKLVINYYSRLLFAAMLLPALKEGAKRHPDLGARVISVYSAGQEGPVIESDIELVKEENFSSAQAARQASALNSLAMEYLSQQNPEVGWMHASPGMVMTGLMRDMPAYIRVFNPVMSLLSTSLEDSGQGFLRLSTDMQYAKGLALVDWKGKVQDTRHGRSGMLGGAAGWWKEGLGETVWRHTGELYERVLGQKVW
jgi:NAD(P)-dependent dehydrogenase (short-subunit alcohol dehydrogenase family)